MLLGILAIDGGNNNDQGYYGYYAHGLGYGSRGYGGYRGYEYGDAPVLSPSISILSACLMNKAVVKEGIVENRRRYFRRRSIGEGEIEIEDRNAEEEVVKKVIGCVNAAKRGGYTDPVSTAGCLKRFCTGTLSARRDRALAMICKVLFIIGIFRQHAA